MNHHTNSIFAATTGSGVFTFFAWMNTADGRGTIAFIGSAALTVASGVIALRTKINAARVERERVKRDADRDAKFFDALQEIKLNQLRAAAASNPSEVPA